MNERIEELLAQSRAECMKNGMKMATTVGYDELQRFAELIVQECVQVMAATAKEAKENFTYMGDDVPTSVLQSAVLGHFKET